jgi:hypothetical protein
MHAFILILSVLPRKFGSIVFRNRNFVGEHWRTGAHHNPAARMEVKCAKEWLAENSKGDFDNLSTVLTA